MQRLYVLVRKDLAPHHRAVQAGHAVAQWCANEASRWKWDGRDVTTPPWRWANGVLIYLLVKDEKELREWFERFRQKESPMGLTEGAVAWHEPDWQDQMTAFAVIGKREDFENLPLLR